VTSSLVLLRLQFLIARGILPSSAWAAFYLPVTDRELRGGVRVAGEVVARLTFQDALRTQGMTIARGDEREARIVNIRGHNLRL
jgi:hypothetical protein